MKVFVLIFFAVSFMLQACVSDSETHKKKSEKSFPKNEESGQIKNQETEISETTNIKKGSIGPAKTVKIKILNGKIELDFDGFPGKTCKNEEIRFRALYEAVGIGAKVLKEDDKPDEEDNFVPEGEWN